MLMTMKKVYASPTLCAKNDLNTMYILYNYNQDNFCLHKWELSDVAVSLART